MNYTRLRQYRKHMNAAKAQGAFTALLKCPACQVRIDVLRPNHAAQTWDSKMECPLCDALLFKTVHGDGRAEAVLPRPLPSPRFAS